MYHVWYKMKRRCENPDDSSYFRYGSRGIAVCDEWQNYEAFVDWALANGYDANAPKGECTIERIDVNGDCEPTNCRWANTKEQANNRRNNRTLTYKGKTLTIAQWAEETGLRHAVILNRINQGWDVEMALTTPVTKGNRWLEGRFIGIKWAD